MSLLKECFTLSIRLTTMGGCFGCREWEGDIPFKLWSNNNLNNSEERSMPMKSCGEGVETHGDCVEILCNALSYRGNRLAAQGIGLCFNKVLLRFNKVLLRFNASRRRISSK